MESKVRHKIIMAFRQMLGAIIRLALRNGIGYVEFSDICKSLYVEISANEYGVKGRRTNDSRIALLTGLDRREIKKVREKKHSQDDSGEEVVSGRMAKILSAWYQDELYTDENKRPKELPLEGSSPTFANLVKQYGGDIPVITVLREFKNSKVVVETENGDLRVLKPYFVPNYLSDASGLPNLVDPELITHGSSMLVDHINTIFHNLYCADHGLPKRVELRATNTYIKKSSIPDFHQFVKEHGVKFLTQADAWLTEHELEVGTSEPVDRLGVGIYFIEGNNTSLG